MYPLGHISIAYLLANIIMLNKKWNHKLDISIIMGLSLLPDIDLLIPLIQHRGPTHSILFSIMVFIPLIIRYNNRALPYFIALLSHSVIGDYFTDSGIQLLWPLSNKFIRYKTTLRLNSLKYIYVEITLFLTALLFYYVKKNQLLTLEK